MSRPAVSVIIPTYNRANFLRLALDSLARQSVRDFETIVVDDGSTEDTESVVRNHPVAARFIRQSRGGPALARNHGVAESSADTIAFLDSDDEWLPTKLERFRAAMSNRPDVRIWYGPMNPIDQNGHLVAGRTKACEGGWITNALFHSSFVHVPSVVMHRSVFDEFGGFNPRLPVCEDYDLWLRISTRYEFGLVPEPLALRRLHDQRLSKACMRRNLAVKADVLESFLHSPAARTALESISANRRVARVLLAAARSALRDYHGRDAEALAARARAYGASPARTGSLTALARLSRWLGLDRTPPETATVPEPRLPVQNVPAVKSR